MARHELLHKALVGGLGEPALLVHQRHNAHRLERKAHYDSQTGEIFKA
jgi:hypothetical protein